NFHRGPERHAADREHEARQMRPHPADHLAINREGLVHWASPSEGTVRRLSFAAASAAACSIEGTRVSREIAGIIAIAISTVAATIENIHENPATARIAKITR